MELRKSALMLLLLCWGIAGPCVADQSLIELVREGVKAAENGDDKKLESIFPEANTRPWKEFKELIESVNTAQPMEKLMISSLVAYSPQVENALNAFRAHKNPEVRLCVLCAGVERFAAEGRKLDEKGLDSLRALTESQDPIVAARALLSLMVGTTPSDPKYDPIRERIHAKLKAIKKPDEITLDLIRYLETRPPEPKNGEQGGSQ